MCTLHMYKPAVQPVASRSMFLDIQVLTSLLRKFILFPRANLCYPTTRLLPGYYFSTVFLAHLCIYRRMMGCKRSFNCRMLHFCISINIFMSSLCGVGVRIRVRVNNFSKTTRPRDMLFFLKDTLSIKDEKLFKACKSVCSSVC